MKHLIFPLALTNEMRGFHYRFYCGSKFILVFKRYLLIQNLGFNGVKSVFYSRNPVISHYGKIYLSRIRRNIHLSRKVKLCHVIICIKTRQKLSRNYSTNLQEEHRKHSSLFAMCSTPTDFPPPSPSLWACVCVWMCFVFLFLFSFLVVVLIKQIF